MLLRIQKYLAGVKPVFLDGLLYILIAAFGTMSTIFSGEEAYKYVNPFLLFWIKAVCGILLACVSALKMFRSRSYADHADDKAEKAGELPPRKEN